MTIEKKMYITGTATNKIQVKFVEEEMLKKNNNKNIK